MSNDAVDWTATSFADHEVPQWFRDAPLGIFIHWGAYSVPAWAEPIGELGTFDNPVEWFSHNPYAEWYFNTSAIECSPAQQHQQEVFGGAPYDDFLDAWRAESFDPADLAALFRTAGADYVVPTTKHHDGITLWDAPGTDGRNTVARGPQQDLVAALATAVRGAGLRFGVYYSGGIDWHQRPASSLPDFGTNPMPVPTDDAYGVYAARHVRDLVDRFQPDVLWNDITWPEENRREGADGLVELFEHYYATVPEGVVNDRWADTHHDYLTSEYQAGREHEGDEPWENCRGIGLSFGYNQLEDERHYLDGPALARHLTDCVSRGGRFLLNVGPKADGTLPDLQRRALKHLGAWMVAAKPELVGAQVIDTAIDEDGPYVRWLGHDDRLTAVVDLAGERWTDQPTGTVTATLPAGAGAVRATIGGDASVADGTLTVELAADRPGPAVVILDRA